MSFKNSKPAVWSDMAHFSVSEKGAIKPSGSGYGGQSCFLTLDAAQHILDNLDSFRQAVIESKNRTLKNETNKEYQRIVSTFIKQGLTPEQAVVAAEMVYKNKTA